MSDVEAGVCELTSIVIARRETAVLRRNAFLVFLLNVVPLGLNRAGEVLGFGVFSTKRGSDYFGWQVNKAFFNHCFHTHFHLLQRFSRQ